MLHNKNNDCIYSFHSFLFFFSNSFCSHVIETHIKHKDMLEFGSFLPGHSGRITQSNEEDKQSRSMCRSGVKVNRSAVSAMT